MQLKKYPIELFGDKTKTVRKKHKIQYISPIQFEQLVRVWVKHYILCPKRIVFRLENDFYNRDKMRIEAAEKKEATSDE